MQDLIRCEALGVSYPNGVTALRSVSLGFVAGAVTALLGPSGAGKSTLLRCLNGLAHPTAGRVLAEGLGDLAERDVLRRHRLRTGMVFQDHALIGRRHALANVLIGRLGHHPTWRTLLGFGRDDRLAALAALDRVGLLERALTRADELSGGQRQRVGIARALAQAPRLILADEPVASLDPATAADVLAHLRDIAACDGIGVVVSLHQPDLARRFADRIVGIAGGAVVCDVPAARFGADDLAAIYRATSPLPPARIMETAS